MFVFTIGDIFQAIVFVVLMIFAIYLVIKELK